MAHEANMDSFDYTECSQIYRKNVLHLHTYKFAADAIQICGRFWSTQYNKDKEDFDEGKNNTMNLFMKM